ncbi:ArsI/CadI family heavy metal resistance metalloenzyme [Enhygromyxa salina]|uniref:Cadmium-induced protein CadI n=1 Tax=Enhygromyxa salina TaxID=215803 RepID=A0A2S9XQI1_9BACT|nr:ArsI/CadI family heavy metal resistance metalloenzyme [Enhygromyxa salina]PRP95129.1 Cadmium-induced protein CadI [Enhygromyxa salina]
MEHRTTAVHFPTQMRAHIALACSDIAQSRAFYEQLLELEPTKVRDGYVKFEVLEPPLNLTLNYSPDPPRQTTPAHFGIQVKSTAQVLERRQAMARANFDGRTEEGVGCCFAVQDKVWFADPDGNQWEVFVVTQADIAEHSQPALNAPPTAEQAEPEPEPEPSCCAPTCCE